MATARYCSAGAIAECCRFFQRAEKPTPSAHYFQDISENGNSSIARIIPRGVECGEISTLFHEMWAVISTETTGSTDCSSELLDWLDSPMLVPGTDSFSSAATFSISPETIRRVKAGGRHVAIVPKLFGHLSRKFVVYQGACDNSLQAYPGAFYSSNWRVPVPRHTGISLELDVRSSRERAARASRPPGVRRRG